MKKKKQKIKLPIKYKIGSIKRIGQHKKGKITIDKKVPRKYRNSVALHEKVEEFEEKHNKLPYQKAHKLANDAEKTKIFHGNKKAWTKYEKEIMKEYKKNLAKKKKKKK